jgi:hypothetical protein
MAEAVVRRSLLRIGQHLVGFFGLLEFLFGSFRRLAVTLTLIAIRMVLHRLLAIRLLDVVL